MRMAISANGSLDAIEMMEPILMSHRVFGQATKGAQDARNEVKTFIETCINVARYDGKPLNRSVAIIVESDHCGVKGLALERDVCILSMLPEPKVVPELINIQYFEGEFKFLMDYVPMPKLTTRGEPTTATFIRTPEFSETMATTERKL